MLIGHKNKSIAVKTLVEFAATTGSLDYRFTPSPTGQEGIEGHQQVRRKRATHYQAELGLNIIYKERQYKGRADGYDPAKHCIEEIKTFYGDINTIADNHRALHWAQAKCYGWMMCKEKGCEQINIALVYFNLTDEKEYRFEESFHINELIEFCESLADKYDHWSRSIDNRLTELHHWIEKLPFPLGDLYPSQRIMAETVYKAAAMKRVVLAEAPTGTGKTLASLFPAIKAMTRTEVDKIFYLTSKTTGKQLALDAIRLIASDTPSPLRTLELTALEKACLEPDKECQGDSCPYAFNFYDKLQQARLDASNQSILDKAALNKIALQHEICPFYLSMEMARWADLIIADVNYYFDGTPLLLALTQEFNWKPYLLIDESHNLVDRARQMYSAELSRDTLLLAKKQSPEKLKKILARINKYWLELINDIPEDEHDYSPLEMIPEKLLLSLQEFTNAFIALLQVQPEYSIKDSSVKDFFFTAVGFLKVAELVDQDFCIDMQSVGSKSEIITLRNLIPAKLLSARVQQSYCAAFFSATLSPVHFYQQLLGLPDDHISIQVPSPFSSDQLSIHIAKHISTRYKDRQNAIPKICELITSQLQTQPGNALVFFSSYEFLLQAEAVLKTYLPNDIQLLTQSRQMNEQDRKNFIDQFREQNNLLGLVVLGGAFSEGIDLPGDKLKGAFIATLGLPQVNPVNERMCKLLQKQFNQGYHFTYTYPGIQKVIQAAGRVIRTTSDKGYLWLLDDRYADDAIKSLLPKWWMTNSCHQ
jgi:DNA excision repair protein ERCC-2